MNWYKRASKEYFFIKTTRFPIPSEIIKNPTRDDINRLQKDNQIRLFLYGNDLYVWTPYELLHNEVARELGLKENRIPLFGLVHRGKIFNVWATDASEETQWHHNSQLKNEILKHPVLKSLVDPGFKSSPENVNYYDESIVGPWHEKSELQQFREPELV
jgi:hypothetical protein